MMPLLIFLDAPGQWTHVLSTDYITSYAIYHIYGGGPIHGVSTYMGDPHLWGITHMGYTQMWGVHIYGVCICMVRIVCETSLDSLLVDQLIGPAGIFAGSVSGAGYKANSP